VANPCSSGQGNLQGIGRPYIGIQYSFSGFGLIPHQKVKGRLSKSGLSGSMFRLNPMAKC
jgi:hypothetical protein